MKSKCSRLFPARSGGLHKELGRYWQGQRAEAIVEARAAERQRSRRKPRSGSTPTQSPQRELRRLERALARRKTLAARQRVQQRIDVLRKELGC